MLGPPALARAGPEVPEDVPRRLRARFGDWRAVRAAVADALHAHNPGEELRGEELRLMRALLEQHPDRAEKVGAGVRGIKVDESLHASGSKCFWVLRIDGSAEDFSARKCLKSLQEAWCSEPLVRGA